MADGYVDQVTLPDNTTYTLNDSTLQVYSGTCSTSASTAIKDVTCPNSFSLKKGVIVFVTFTNTNSAATSGLKLRVNSSANADAKPIKHEFNTAESELPSTDCLRANQTYQFYYDGTNWVTLLDYNLNCLSLTGGALTGNLILKTTTGHGDSPYISFQRDSVNDEWTDWHIKVNSNGVLTFAQNLSGTTNTTDLTMFNFAPSTNSNNLTPKLYPGLDDTFLLGTTDAKWKNVYATTFTGDLNGTAAYATADAEGNVISTTYALDTHTHGDISRTGTMTNANRVVIVDNSNKITTNERLTWDAESYALTLGVNSNKLVSTTTYGSITVNNGNVTINSGNVAVTSQDYNFIRKITSNYSGATTGWARGVITVTDNSDAEFARIGVRGTGSTFDYWYIGDESYNGNNLRVYSGGITWSPSFSVSAGSNVSNGGKYTITTTGVEYGKLTGSTSGAAILWSKRVIGLYPGKTDDDTATPASDYQSTNKYFFFTDVFRTDSNGTINIGSTTKKFKDIHSVTSNSTQFSLYSSTTEKAQMVYNTTLDSIDFIFV